MTRTVERTSPRRDAAGAAALVPAVALATVLVLDVLRVWMPSIIFIYGRAGSTPAERMGLFALAWVALGLLTAAAVRVVPPAVALLAATGVLGIARAVLQLWEGGGDVQLHVASVGWVAAMALLGALAATAPPGRAVATGLAFGLVADATLRAATGSVELTWIPGLGGTVAGLALVVAAVAAMAMVVRSGLLDDVGPAPAWPWLLVGPVLVLHGILAGNPARVVAAVDLAWWAAAGLTVAALALGAAWTVSSGALPARASARLAAVLVLVGTMVAVPADGWGAVIGQVLLAVGLGGILARLSIPARGRRGPLGRSLAAAGSLALLFLVVFLYYAAYDIAFGFDHRLFLFATAVAVAALVASVLPHADGDRLVTGRALPLGLAAAVLLAAGGAAFGTPRGAAPGDGFPVRVMLYNVHMGFDTLGRFDTGALAAVVAEQEADIVVLNEVDRGWFLNGSHDVLHPIAGELDMPYVFAPAADEIWGNAILSRYPLEDARDAALPRGAAAMARSFVSAVVDLGQGDRLGVVATHLHHVDGEGGIRAPQAVAVAAEAERLADRGLPVVVMGDMNAEPGTPELEPYLAAGLADAVTPLGSVLTFPSWDPVAHIDHVFVSPDLAATALTVPRSEASDHLGVAVTLTHG